MLCNNFELLEDKPLRTKVLIWNPSEENETKLKKNSRNLRRTKYEKRIYLSQ